MKPIAIAVLTASLTTLALPAAAQAVPGEVFATQTSDLDADGLPEVWQLARGIDDTVDLTVRAAGRTRTFPALVWTGAMEGTTPTLALSPAGSVQVMAGNQSIGRGRWMQTLTVAWRDGDYVLAGVTSTWYDTLDPDAHGTCDVNLLTGRGTAERGGGPAQAIAVPGLVRLPLAAWSVDSSIPACDDS